MIDINKLRVASPCSVGWESMSGDERSRHCGDCRLNVYNISGMTAPEVQKLIADREGRLCVRLMKRADGTVITKDCPVGLRGYHKRMARTATAAFGAVLAMFSSGIAQRAGSTDKRTYSAEMIARNGTAVISGTVVDPNGAVVPNAEILLFQNDVKKPLKAKSDESGRFRFEKLSAGNYRIEVSIEYFRKLIVKAVEIKDRVNRELLLHLEVSSDSVVVGIFVDPPMIEIDSSTVKTTITQDILRRIPL